MCFIRDSNVAREPTALIDNLRHIHKTHRLNTSCLKNRSVNLHHQPPTSCFANSSVLQHVPGAVCGCWLRTSRTKQTPFTEISSAGEPASSSPHVAKPHFLAHKLCTRRQSAQLCRMTYTRQMVPALLHQNCWCAQGSAKIHRAFPQLNTLPNHREVQKAIEHHSVQQHEQLACHQVQISCDSGLK